MHRTVKQAVGWYAANRKGGALAQSKHEPRVQEAPADPTDRAFAIAAVLGRVCGRFEVDPEMLTAWASTSDEGGCPPDKRLLRALRGELEEAKLLAPKVKRVPCARHTWSTVSGDAITTMRELQAGRLGGA